MPALLYALSLATVAGLSAPDATSVRPAGDGLPARSPAAAGMSAKRLETIDRVVARGIKAGGFPGAAVVVGRKGYAVWERGFGRLGWSGASASVSPDHTVYDLASLTKVVGTTTAAMILFDQGRLRLDDPVARYIPAFSDGAKGRITVRHLLTHRSGLPAGRDLWRLTRSPAEARQAVIDSPLMPGCAPGACFEYSDLGADMLGFVVEAASGERLDAFLQRRVFAPLGMSDTWFRVPSHAVGRTAPTEVTPPRGYPLRGEVHDENAFALGGVAGHAGIFSTASDLSIFAQMMLNGGEYGGVRIVTESTVALFTRRAAGTRALGWDTCGGHGSCGKHLGANAYGHTGFTGTSLWIDPDRELFVILLTNRVHAAKARRPSKVITDVRADLADAATLAVMDFGDPLAMPAAFRADRAVGWNKPEPTARSSKRSKSRSAALAAKRAKGSRSASRSKSATSTKRSRSAATRHAASSRSASVKNSTKGKVKSLPRSARSGSTKSTKSTKSASSARSARTGKKSAR